MIDSYIKYANGKLDDITVSNLSRISASIYIVHIPRHLFFIVAMYDHSLWSESDYSPFCISQLSRFGVRSFLRNRFYNCLLYFFPLKL